MGVKSSERGGGEKEKMVSKKRLRRRHEKEKSRTAAPDAELPEHRAGSSSKWRMVRGEWMRS